MARGIKDKVAILGMGCSKFGERWDSGAEELMLEAYKEAIAAAGIDANQLNAAWFSTVIDEVHVGKSGIPMSTTLRLPNIPVTHVENMCASGTEAFREDLACLWHQAQPTSRLRSASRSCQQSRCNGCDRLHLH